MDREEEFRTKLAELDGQSEKTTGDLNKNFRDMAGGIDGAANGLGKLAGGLGGRRLTALDHLDVEIG